MAALGICVLSRESWSAPLWIIMGVASAGAVLVGAWRHAPRRRQPWWLLAAAICTMTVGDAAFGASAQHGNDPSLLADMAYFATFPLIMAGLVALTRASVVLGDRSRLLDLLMFTCAATLVGWVFIVGPSAQVARLSNADRSTAAAYLTGDLLVLITTLRLALGAGRTWSVLLLSAGTVTMVTADVWYLVIQLRGGWFPGGPVVLGYLIFYGCWGASALHPSMVQLTTRVDHSPARLGRRWLRLLRLSAAVPPATLLIISTGRGTRDGAAIAVAAFVISQFVITRLTDVVEKHGAALARERGLRHACGALVAAVDATEVCVAARIAVGQLVPADADHEVMVSISGADRSPAESAAAIDFALVPSPAADRLTRLLPVRVLHPLLRNGLDRFEVALVCPLLLAGGGGTGSGVMLVAAHERVLVAMRDAVEVLAAQSTLALERIVLTDLINRRDGDRYLRTVVRNTADVVLIVDGDERVRYASPSLATVLGVDPPPDATLRDIVRSDDHAQVAVTRELAERCTGPDGASGVWTLRRPDGSVVVVAVTVRDLRRDRMVRGFVVTMRDITEQRAREREVLTEALRQTPAWRNRQNLLNRFR
jgi:PAS domain S-box-containing protein